MEEMSLKELRCKVYTNTEEDNNKKKKALKKLDVLFGFESSSNVQITFDELKLFKVGERAEINESITFEKTYEDENKLVFLTFLLKGGSFGVHNHDCFEFCHVLKGNLFEKTRGLSVYTVGDTVCYAPNEKHIPYATENSTYEVTFLKKLP